MSISSYTDCFHYTNLLYSAQHIWLLSSSCTTSLFSSQTTSVFLFSHLQEISGLITFSPGQLLLSSRCSFWESSIWSTSPAEGRQLSQDGAPQSLSCLPLTPSGFTYVCSASLFTDCCCFYGMVLGSCQHVWKQTRPSTGMTTVSQPPITESKNDLGRKEPLEVIWFNKPWLEQFRLLRTLFS